MRSPSTGTESGSIVLKGYIRKSSTIEGVIEIEYMTKTKEPGKDKQPTKKQKSISTQESESEASSSSESGSEYSIKPAKSGIRKTVKVWQPSGTEKVKKWDLLEGMKSKTKVK